LRYLELGLVLVIERAMVVLGVAQNVFGFHEFVDRMGWLGLGIAESREMQCDNGCRTSVMLSLEANLNTLF
jgi:hypothetical protein